MKRWIHAKQDAINTQDIDIDFFLDKITYIVIVDDAISYDPGEAYVTASEILGSKDYSDMGREELLNLPKREFERIRNPEILRKLQRSDLTPMQQVVLWQANKENFTSSKHDVKLILDKLKDCEAIYIMPTAKNEVFRSWIQSQGGNLTPRDAQNIVSKLGIKDYSHSTYSYMPQNWNSLLMVFNYRGEYTFEGYKDSTPVTISDLNIYIKIDVDIETGDGYVAMSFHHPEFNLNHPY